MLNVENLNKSVIESFGGYAVKQTFCRRRERWFVHLPKNSGLRELFGRERPMPRSQYVFLRASGSWRVPFGYVVHHKDHDRQRDTPSNLELLTNAEHERHHREAWAAYMLEHGAPFAGRRHSPETIVKFQEIARGRGNNDVWKGAKKTHFDSTLKKMSAASSGENNAMYRGDLDVEALRAHFVLTKNYKSTAEKFVCSVTVVRNRTRDLDVAVLYGGRPDATLDDALVVAAYKEFGTFSAVASALGRSKATIRARLIKAGVARARTRRT